MAEQQSPFLILSRPEWSALRASTPLTLTEADVVELRGINTALSLTEVEEVYLPLSRLLNLTSAPASTSSASPTLFSAIPPPPFPMSSA